MKRSLTTYLKGARGESLIEAEDVDKEIALFKKGLASKDLPVAELIRSNDVIRNVIVVSIDPLLELLSEKAQKLDDLFVQSSNNVRTKNFQGGIDNLEVSKWLSVRPPGNVEYLQFTYSWKAYKYSQQPFAISMSLSVVFTPYHYRLEAGDNKIERLYHEPITPEEMNQITKEIIGKVMAEIKQKSENQSE